jgi:transposase
VVASIGDAKTFRNGRQFAAWLGLVPRQKSSGGKEQLLGISNLLLHTSRPIFTEFLTLANKVLDTRARIA